MRRSAMVMAGGAGSRMQASGGRLPKPLTDIAGFSLLEHNLHQLARHGFLHVIVAAPAHERQIIDAVCDDLRPKIARMGMALELLVEPAPLGNVGAIGLLRDRGEDILTVFADNLTTLDLGGLFDEHRRSGCAATVAVHRHSFRMPFGEVRVAGGRLIDYREKPTYTPTVCSAVCAFAPRALAAAAGEPLGLSELLSRLMARGEPICAYAHAEPWIDVNDLSCIPAAEAMVRAHPGHFASGPVQVRPWLRV